MNNRHELNESTAKNLARLARYLSLQHRMEINPAGVEFNDKGEAYISFNLPAMSDTDRSGSIKYADKITMDVELDIEKTIGSYELYPRPSPPVVWRPGRISSRLNVSVQPFLNHPEKLEEIVTQLEHRYNLKRTGKAVGAAFGIGVVADGIRRSKAQAAEARHKDLSMVGTAVAGAEVSGGVITTGALGVHEIYHQLFKPRTSYEDWQAFVTQTTNALDRHGHPPSRER